MNAADTDAAASLTQEQKEYLQGFTAGLAAVSAVPIETPDLPSTGSSAPSEPASWFGWPVDEITREELLKREENPLDIWDKLLAHAQQDQPP
jgi:ferredoxin-nitrite reductase